MTRQSYLLTLANESIWVARLNLKLERMVYPPAGRPRRIVELEAELERAYADRRRALGQPDQLPLFGGRS